MSGRPAHPALPGHLLAADEFLGDVEQQWPVLATTRPYDASFISVREDRVQAPAGGELSRTIVEHHGAVGVVAVDERDRILLLRQYRHAVGRRLLEIPAGILDVDGESAADAAARELGEEADLVADRWELLVEMYSSPGFTDERLDVFLATDLRPVPVAERTPRAEEEADMDAVWVPVHEAVAAVLDRRITNSLAVSGILAVAAVRS